MATTQEQEVSIPLTTTSVDHEQPLENPSTTTIITEENHQTELEPLHKQQEEEATTLPSSVNNQTTTSTAGEVTTSTEEMKPSSSSSSTTHVTNEVDNTSSNTGGSATAASSSVNDEVSHLEVNIELPIQMSQQEAFTISQSFKISNSKGNLLPETPIKEYFEKKEPTIFINDRDVISEFKLKTKNASNLKGMNPIPMLKNQTVEVGKDENDNPIRRRVDFKDALVQGIVEKEGDEQKTFTAFDSFKNACEKYPDRPCLGVISSTKDVHGKTTLGVKFENYKQIEEKSLDLGSALRNLGIHPHYHVGIYSKNRPEWQITSEACNSQSLITIALYDTLGEESSIYIMNHGEIVALFVSGDEIFSKNVYKWANQCEYLKYVILYKNLENENYDRDVAKWKEEFKTMTKGSTKLLTFEEVLAMGTGDKRVATTPPRACDLATIMYTSGTTGMPKGVMRKYYL